MADDDDFDDFGGFEAADPVVPNVAQALPPGLEASPAPWAMFPPVSSTRGVQPDLLCNQNRFPHHLDPPTAQAGAAALAPDNHPLQLNDMGAPFDAHFNGDRNSTDDLDEVSSEDEVTLANDILDGSFRSASGSLSGVGSLTSHSRDVAANITGLDLALDIVMVPETPGYINPVVLPEFSVRTHREPSVQVDHYSQEHSEITEAAESDVRHTGNDVTQSSVNRRVSPTLEQNHVTAELPGEISNNRSAEDQNEAESLSSSGGGDSQNEKTDKNLQSELDATLGRTHQLEGELATCQTELEVLRQKYEQLQIKHAAELEEIRKAGHDALAVVVEEYKELSRTAVLQEHEASKQLLVSQLRQEEEHFQSLLCEQKEYLDTVLEAERLKNEERLQEALNKQRTEQQAKFDTFLEEERKKHEEDLKNVIQKEQEASQRAIEAAIQEELIKSKQHIEDEKLLFAKSLEEVKEDAKKEMQEAISQERSSSEGLLKAALVEERTCSKESVKQSIEGAREEMKSYIQEQRQADCLLRQRHLSSLDLFLDSARQQLKLLMETEKAGGDNSTKSQS